MGRPTRIQFAGACYYITLQGNNRQDIFLSNQDRRFFLSLLKRYKDLLELKVYAYCLMNNRVELLVETLQPNLSRVMQGFNTVYTKYFNRQHNTVGHIFQGRYKALLVDKDAYLSEMTQWVHLSPVRAGLKIKPWRYQWSSCAAYVESETREPLVDSGVVLRPFGKSRLKQSVTYLQFIKERMPTAARPMFPVHAYCIGSPDFAASVLKIPVDQVSQSFSGSKEKARQIIEAVVARGISEERLLSRVRWGGAASARKEAIYRIWKEAQLGVTEIGRIFHRTPSAISQMLQSIEASGGWQAESRSPYRQSSASNSSRWQPKI